MVERADYGLDAPGVVRNLGLASAAGVVAFGSITAGLWSGLVPLGGVVLDVSSMTLSLGLACGAMALYMVWSSKRGKTMEREELLDRLTFRGDERVLDVGCGRGLMLIGAAKRLSTGSAVGVDIWQAEDLSGNNANATLENARLEGVRDRVRIDTADMRSLPFPDGSFDVIVSKAAIHNLYRREERAKALGEIARVLAPGGQLLIDDIRHIQEYQTELRAQRITDVQRLGSPWIATLWTILTWGSLRPGVLIARRDPAQVDEGKGARAPS